MKPGAPPVVQQAMKLLWVSTLIGFVGELLDIPQMLAVLPEGTPSLILYLVAGVGLLFGVSFLLAVQAGKNWARLFFFAGIIFSLFGTPDLFHELVTQPKFSTVLSVIARLMHFYVTYLFLQPSAVAWFKSGKTI
ncbi:MAG: hypothetical protein EOP09_03615 [Proteobacteria bacterium]|nr:MAG: hypothetical protein EOP09_03615 [Pseudomonadota bacterium]